MYRGCRKKVFSDFLSMDSFERKKLRQNNYRIDNNGF